jgi:glucokinase
LAERLQAEFGARALVENDGNAAALGEWRYGAGQACASLLYVTVSTGVGGGWIVNGALWRGADGLAGEIGHLVLKPDGPVCACGKHGCVEALAAGPYLAARARVCLQADERASPRLRALVEGDLSRLTAKHVALAAQAGDELAWQLLSDAARALGQGMGAALVLMNPQRVVVGGGVAKSGERYWQVMREAAAAETMPAVRVEIVPAALGDDAPLWGAVALAETLLPGAR